MGTIRIREQRRKIRCEVSVFAYGINSERVTNGRDRDRTDDLYRVKVALIPTELRARGNRLEL